MKFLIVGAGIIGKATRATLRLTGDHEYGFWDVVEERRTVDLPWPCDAAFLCLHEPGASVQRDSDLVVEWAQRLRGQARWVVQRSTCVPGTAERASFDWDSFDLGGWYIVWPEFLNAHNWEAEAVNPSRTVLGLAEGAEPPEFLRGLPGPRFEMSWREAEFVKLVANAALVTRISFWNDIGPVPERVREAVAADPRLASFGFPHDGRPWGGHCFPKDVDALVEYLSGRGRHPWTVLGAVETNNWLDTGQAGE